MELALQSLPALLQASLVTVGLAAASMAAGLVIGLLSALIRIARIPVLSHLMRAYVSIIRGTPLLVQIYLVYYGPPQFGWHLEPVPSAIVALSLNVGAYLSESFRGAIESVSKGQMEAAYTLGMTYWTAMRRIIVPQSLRTALPTVGNTYIGLLKDTSLVSVITVTELLRQSNVIIARTWKPLTIYMTAAVLYWFMSTMFSFVQERVERRVSRHV
ncbi:MAG: amino acid ABC transporter permease [Limnochordales bacterium]|nr:amino acid ABC transporter permease [Limnochordales bacterium]